jgi:hypothetical protein
MIPEQYWRILGRWWWLIGGVAVFTALLAIVAAGQFVGKTGATNSSAVTLGVTRIVSFGGTVTVGGSGDPQLLASYTENIAERGNTPQFRKVLSERLALQGVAVSDSALGKKVDFKPVPGLFRIEITAESDTAAEAQIIAEAAAALLVEEVTAEENRIKTTLREASAQQQTELLNRLNTVYQARITRLSALGEPALKEALDNLVRRGITPDLSAEFSTLVQDLARISADPEMAIMNSEAQSLEQQLANLSDSQRGFSDEILRGNPVSVVTPASTAPVPPAPTLRTRDIALMGLVVGLVAGWVLASLAEGWSAQGGPRLPRIELPKIERTGQSTPSKPAGWTPPTRPSGLERFSSRD